jgi:5'-3' exoribonuclease 2
LEFDLAIPNPPFDIEFERLVDDFVFMCFFVGNDFLPHMPTLEIREGAINLLMSNYKQNFRTFGGYLTKDGEVNFSRVEKFIQYIGSMEDTIFQKRARIHQRQQERRKRDQQNKNRQRGRGDDAQPTTMPETLYAVERNTSARLANAPQAPVQIQQRPSTAPPAIGDNHQAAQLLRASLQKNKKQVNVDTDIPDSVMDGPEPKLSRLNGADTCVTSGVVSTPDDPMVQSSSESSQDADENAEDLKIKLKTMLRDKADVLSGGGEIEDSVRLGEPGWKERYYTEKFECKSPDEVEAVRKDVALKFAEGLCWVMRYYYQGVCSWSWYYPYHYAPFASDLTELDQMEITFFIGKPFKPFDQLMGVLPAASSQALPVQYRNLMTDPNSPIIDFYPRDFVVDMNGKRFSWQGVAKLPFIEADRLLEEIKEVEPSLTEEEKRRNSELADLLFITHRHTLAPSVFSFYDKYAHVTGPERAKVSEVIDPMASGGMNGRMHLCEGEACPPTFTSPVDGCPNITSNQVLSLIYTNPPHHRHICKPVPGVTMPKKTISEQDVKVQPLWHEDNGQGHRNHGGNRPQYGHDNRNYGDNRQQGGYQGQGGGYERQQRQSPAIGEAGNRLLAGCLPFIRNQYSGNNNDQYQNQHQGGGRSGVPNGPPPQAYGNRGPYDQGYQSSQYQSGGSRQQQQPRESPYHSRGPASSAPYVQPPQYPPVNGFYAPQALPTIGGPGLLQQQGGYVQQPAPLLPVMPAIPEPVYQAGGYQRGSQIPAPYQQQNYQRGVQNPQQQQPYRRGAGSPQQNYQRGVQNPPPPSNNSYSVLDNRSRGFDGRGRGGGSNYPNRNNSSKY